RRWSSGQSSPFTLRAEVEIGVFSFVIRHSDFVIHIRLPFSCPRPLPLMLLFPIFHLKPQQTPRSTQLTPEFCPKKSTSRAPTIFTAAARLHHPPQFPTGKLSDIF